MNPEDRYVVIDVETAQSYDHIIEVAAVEVIGRTVSSRSFVRRIKPRSAMSPFCYAVHRISLAELEREPYFEHVVHDLIDFVGNDTIVAHNYAYEYNTLKREFERAARPAYPRERFFAPWLWRSARVSQPNSVRLARRQALEFLTCAPSTTR